MKQFYQKHKKPILFFVGFVIFVLLAVTIIDGDATYLINE